MNILAFPKQCIFDIHDGLQGGLSHFSQPSRASLVFTRSRDEEMHVYDPQGLLRGHEPMFKKQYLDSGAWRDKTPHQAHLQKYGHIHPAENLELAGLISYGCHSRPVLYQRWFTEHHPDMCSTGPTQRWLENAAWRLSHDIANEESLYTGISGQFLREYATHAVRDFILDQMNLSLGWDSHIRVYAILESVLGISITPEEGEWPVGKLVFVEPVALERIEFLARFPLADLPELKNYKHVRKLLQCVEGTPRMLISDGLNIHGIAVGEISDFCIAAHFMGKHGFLFIGSEPVCSFSDDGFHSTTYRARMVQLEEALIESDIDPQQAHLLFQIATRIVHHAEASKRGCTIVIDLQDSPVFLSGHCLQQPLDLRGKSMLKLAQSLARIDGAIHIGADLQLHGFACLLDGKALQTEDRSRGARFNSALRFTAEHRNVIVVVVSSDRPVSIIQEGVELNAQCVWNPIRGTLDHLPTLQEWLYESHI
jgi:hypothetical protein